MNELQQLISKASFASAGDMDRAFRLADALPTGGITMEDYKKLRSDFMDKGDALRAATISLAKIGVYLRFETLPATEPRDPATGHTTCEIFRVPDPVREALKTLADAVFGAGLASEPDVYADYDKLCALNRTVIAALATDGTKP